MSAKMESLPLQKRISFKARMIALVVLVAVVAVVASIVAIQATGSTKNLREPTKNLRPTVPAKVHEQPTVPQPNHRLDRTFRIGNHSVS